MTNQGYIDIPLQVNFALSVYPSCAIFTMFVLLNVPYRMISMISKFCRFYQHDTLLCGYRWVHEFVSKKSSAQNLMLQNINASIFF